MGEPSPPCLERRASVCLVSREQKGGCPPLFMDRAMEVQRKQVPPAREGRAGTQGSSEWVVQMVLTSSSPPGSLCSPVAPLFGSHIHAEQPHCRLLCAGKISGWSGQHGAHSPAGKMSSAGARDESNRIRAERRVSGAGGRGGQCRKSNTRGMKGGGPRHAFWLSSTLREENVHLPLDPLLARC